MNECPSKRDYFTRKGVSSKKDYGAMLVFEGSNWIITGVLWSKRPPARPEHHSHLKWIWTLKVQLSPAAGLGTFSGGPNFLGQSQVSNLRINTMRPCKLGRSIWSHLLLRLLKKELKKELQQHRGTIVAQDGLHACGEGFQWQRNWHHGDQIRAPGNYLLSSPWAGTAGNTRHSLRL